MKEEKKRKIKETAELTLKIIAIATFLVVFAFSGAYQQIQIAFKSGTGPIAGNLLAFMFMTVIVISVIKFVAFDI